STFIQTNNDIANYTEEQKQKLYAEALEKYQILNTITIGDGDLFGQKMDLKQYLLGLSQGADTQLLAQSLLYDVEDATDQEKHDVLVEILEQFDGTFDSLDIDVTEYINVPELPASVQQSLSKFSSLSDLFQNTSPNTLFEQGKNLLEQGDSFLQDNLNNLIGR
ncbi:hypothetical protein MK079_04070, partial [Candidatus Gracilibacteria bacterium]|nr:hypothetical protein [Candidatus Gracilibacteria bacterium]